MIKKFLIAKILFLLFTCFGFCQSEQLVINLSPSANDLVFTFENPKGSIKVTGYDGNDIVVNAGLRFVEAAKPPGNSMKRIEQNPFDISAETNGNTIVLYTKPTGKTVDFDIKIPRNFSLKLKSLDNGNVQIININGEIDIENPNGDISLENISGSVVLTTVYGDITAAFREVKHDSPMMFTSFEGGITLELPVAVNATLKMKSGTGEIHTDFDLIPPKREPDYLEDWIVGSINTGGPEYIIRSYSGNIIIKKRQVIR